MCVSSSPSQGNFCSLSFILSCRVFFPLFSTCGKRISVQLFHYLDESLLKQIVGGLESLWDFIWACTMNQNYILGGRDCWFTPSIRGNRVILVTTYKVHCSLIVKKALASSARDPKFESGWSTSFHYRSLVKKGPRAVHLTLGSNGGVGRHSSYQYFVLLSARSGANSVWHRGLSTLY